jgi:hypothetical protein
MIAAHIHLMVRSHMQTGMLSGATVLDIFSPLKISPSQAYPIFVQRMNSQIPYNTNGKIRAIPIITYHNLTNSIQDYNAMASTITVNLFAQQMKFLHDNGFKVLVLNQLGFDPTKNVFYVKNTH